MTAGGGVPFLSSYTQIKEPNSTVYFVSVGLHIRFLTFFVLEAHVYDSNHGEESCDRYGQDRGQLEILQGQTWIYIYMTKNLNLITLLS